MTKSNMQAQTPESSTRSREFKALGFIIFLLFPALTIAGIGFYGLVIWMIQAFGGVAGH